MGRLHLAIPSLAASVLLVGGCTLQNRFKPPLRPPEPAPTLPASRPAPKPPAPSAPPRPPVPVVFQDDKPYSLELRGVELAQAFDLLGAMGGVNLMLLGDFTEPVAGAFPAVKLQSAFATLCDVHGCRVDQRDGIWMVSRADPGREETRLFELQNVPAASIETQLKAILGGKSTVVTNPSRNVISATATADRLAEAERFVTTVDRLDRQVLIECRILEVDESDLVQIGVEINAGDISIGETTETFISSFLSTTPNIIATASADNFPLDASLEALADRINLVVLSRPKLLSLNNKDAKLNVIQEVPYVNATTSTTGSAGGTGTVTVQEVAFKDVGLKLTFTPSIQEDGHIGIHIVQDVSEQTGTFLTVPVVDSRMIDNWFVVKEGDTLRIGGILLDRTRHELRGIPGLMDIPYLGALFSFTSDDQQKVDLEILITPHIIESPAPPDATAEASVSLPHD